MRNCILLLVACMQNGCATSRWTDRFPANQIVPDDAYRLAYVHELLAEPPFWRSSGLPFPEQYSAYRLTVLPSKQFAACITIHRGHSYDAILRTKLLTWSRKHPSRPDKMDNESEGLIFDESRILPEPKIEAFLMVFHELDVFAPDFPLGIQDILSAIDGTSFFLEAYECGDYRLIQINDPTMEPLTDEAKNFINNVFPGFEVDSLEPFTDKYLALLKWMAQETNLAIFEEYRNPPNYLPEDTVRRLADPTH